MTDIEIRIFRATDAEAVQRIRAAAFAPVFASFRSIVGPTVAETAFARAEEEQAKLLEDFCAPGSKNPLFVATRDGRIVGFFGDILDADQKVGEIGLNAVDPVHANRGIGTAMYRYGLDFMRSAGMTVATVATGGRPQPRARAAGLPEGGLRPRIAVGISLPDAVVRSLPESATGHRPVGFRSDT